jgi:thioredoxin 1
MNQEVDFTPLTEKNFQKEVLDHPGSVLVLFTKDSYGGHHIIAKVMKEVLPEFRSRVKFAKFEVDQSGLPVEEYRIREIPTVLLFRNGVVVDYLSGTFRKKRLRNALEALSGDLP